MLALVIGIAVPVGMLLDRRTRLPGWVAAGVAVAITVLGLLGIKLVAGM
jgi:type VI protein secretion system component VasF